MEVLNEQKQLSVACITALFEKWEQHLREMTGLRDALKNKDDTVASLSRENAQLREENLRLETSCGDNESPRLKALIENHNSLYKEYELQRLTAEANQQVLLKQLRKERDKLRSWNRFSSPSARSPSLPLAAVDPASGHVHSTKKGEAKTICRDIGDRGCRRSVAEQPSPHGENADIHAEIEPRPNRFNTTISSHDKQHHVDATEPEVSLLEKPVEAKQPGESNGTAAFFLDEHLPDESRNLSPELPVMPENRQITLMTGEKIATRVNRIASEESLPQIQHSDSTLPPSDEAPAIEMEESSAHKDPDSDTPEFLGSRRIKNNTSPKVYADGCLPGGSATEPVTIKSDPDTRAASIGPPQLTRFPSSMRESLDPSTQQCLQFSPRKHRPAPPLQPTSSGVELRGIVNELQPLNSPRGRIDYVVPDRPGQLLDEALNGQGRNRRNAEQATPLRQIDGNARKVQRNAITPAGPESNKRKSDDSRGVAAISSISEDGEVFTKRARRTPKARNSPRPANPSAHERLGSLLTEPPARKERLPQISRRNIQEMGDRLWEAALSQRMKAKRPFHELCRSGNKDWEWWDEAEALLRFHGGRGPETPVNHPRRARDEETEARARLLHQITTPTPSRPPAPAAASTNPNHRSTPASPAPAPPPRPRNHQTPYRSLPLSSLHLSHFKLNPTANHNLTYAFTDVVRNQSDRKCLPGCTRPECCGAIFTALAQTLPQPPLHPTTNTPALALPPNPSAPTPSPQDIIARTTYLANKYGRAHRALHGRAPSPPGFWNVDFPATQEREEDRLVAEQRERDEVQRRWSEAIKNPVPGTVMDGRGTIGMGKRRDELGLWMFADE